MVFRLYPRGLESLVLADVVTLRQHLLLSCFKTLSVGPAGV